MIYRVITTEKDLLALAEQKGKTSGINLDYHKVVVKKPWGYEYLMYENQFVAVWVLFLNEGQLTSMHCHPLKKTSLIVLSGSVETSFLEQSFLLHELDGLLIDSKTFHSTRAVSPGGAIIMEIETPPNKNDLVRLKDTYGRENKGYEGISDISFETGEYDYCYFEPTTITQCSVIKHRNVHLHTHSAPEDLLKYLENIAGGVVGILEGKIVDLGGIVLLEHGDTLDVHELKSHMSKGGRINSHLVTLHVH